MSKTWFRAGVVIVVRHPADGRVLVFERSDLAGHWHDTLVCHRIALRGAERSGLDWWAGNMHRNLGRTLNAFDDPAAAREHNLAALRIFEAVGDTRWTAHSLISVARLVRRFHDAAALFGVARVEFENRAARPPPLPSLRATTACSSSSSG